MPIRIALVRLPRLLSDLVAAAFVADDAWIELVEHETDIDLPGTVQHPRPDVVIAEVNDPWKADVADLLTQCPELVVLGVRGDGRSAWSYELAPCPRPLGELGPVQLRSIVLGTLGASS